MTYHIPAGSLKSDRAIRFGRELERAMKARGVGSRTIQDAVGISRNTVRAYRDGRNLPRIDIARKLGEALDWPRLEALGRELRTKTCPVDERTFVDESGSDNRVYCSPSCQRVSEKKRLGSTVTKRAAVAERQLEIHRRAVAAYCAACEPTGRCVTPDCELRPASPLQLFEDRIEELPRVMAKPHNGYRDVEGDRRRQIGVWERYTPDERADRIARASEASKRARGLVPA